MDKVHENLKYWKVIVPRANGKGVLGDVLSSPIVIAPNEGYTQTFIGIGSFATKEEGLHFFLGDGFFARGIDRNLIRVKK